jgi:hypothetical protein
MIYLLTTNDTANQVATPTIGSTPPMGNAFSGSGFWGRRSTPTTANTPTTPKKADLAPSVPRESVNSKTSSTLVPSVTSSSSPQKSEHTISRALTSLTSVDTVRRPSLIDPFPEFEPLLGDAVSIEEFEAVRQILLERYAISQQPPKVQKVKPNAPAAWTRYGMVKGGPETPKRDIPNPPEKWTGLGYDKNNMPTPPPPKTPTRPGIGSSKFSKFSFLGMASKETLPMTESQVSLAYSDPSTPSTASFSPRKVSALPNQVVGSKKRKKAPDEDPEVTALRRALEVNTVYLDELYEEVAEHLGYETWIEMLSQYPADFGELLNEWDEEEEQIVMQFKMENDAHLRRVNDWKFPVNSDDPNNYEFETILDRQRQAYAELHIRRLCADHHQMVHELRVIWASEFWARTQAKWIESRDRHESEKKSQDIQALNTVRELPETASDRVSVKSQNSGRKDALPEEESDKHSVKSNASDKSDDTVTNFNHGNILQSIKAVSREASFDFPASPPTPKAVSRQAIYDFTNSPPTPTAPEAPLRPSSKATETEAEAKRRHRCTAVAVGQLWSPPADDEPLVHGQSKRLASVAIDPESEWSIEMKRIDKQEKQRQKEEEARRRKHPTFTMHPALSERDHALQALEGNDNANRHLTPELPTVREHTGHAALSGRDLALQMLESGGDDDLGPPCFSPEPPTVRQPTGLPEISGRDLALRTLESGEDNIDDIASAYFTLQPPSVRQPTGHPAFSGRDLALQTLESRGNDSASPDDYFNAPPPTMRQPTNPFTKDGYKKPGYRDIRQDASWNMSANYVQRPVPQGARAAGEYQIQRMPASRMRGNAFHLPTGAQRVTPVDYPATAPRPPLPTGTQRMTPMDSSVATQRPPLPDRNPYRLMSGVARPAAAEHKLRAETNPFFRGFVAPPEPEAGERRQGSGGQRTHRRNRHPAARVGYFPGTRENGEMQ